MTSIRGSFISLVLILFVIFAITKTHGQRRKVHWPCTTPEGKSADCVPYAECPTAMQFLRKWNSGSKASVPQYVQTRIKAMHCGQLRNINYVCCEPKPTTTTALPPVTTSGVNSRPGGVKSVDDIEPVIAFLKNQTCGDNGVDKIANGENAALSEFPWMALLVYDDGINPTFSCGGSLIHVRYVLTAAHCVRSKVKGLVRVRLGEHDIRSTEDCQTLGIGSQRHRECAPPIQEIDIEEIIYHEDFRNKFPDDIALVRLVRNAVIAKNVQLICLPVTKRSTKEHLTEATISGWGKIENGTIAAILQKAVIPIKPIEYCQENYKHYDMEFTEKQLCAGGEKNTRTCLGDSGGPIFTVKPYRWQSKYIQYGVVSGGNRQCGSSDLDVYTKVEPYLPWIASNINLD